MSALLFIFMICAPIILTQDIRSSAKHYCYVQSSIDESSFHLTTIQHDDYDSTIRLNELEHLRIHFCKPLKDPCNGKQDYAICLHSNDKEIGVGKEPPKVAIESGKIMFRYSGDKCNETHNYTVDVEMKCHFSNQKKVGDDLDIVYSRHGCSFEMAIETFAACAERKQTKCDLIDKTGYYDLSPLMNLGSNYMIKLNNSTSVILNVCHSLFYGHHSRHCDYKTMICLVDETNTKEPRYKRLGNLNDDMRFSTNNGSVYLDLTSDTPCEKKNAAGLKTIRTTIEFVCDTKAYNTMPEYISGYGTCHYKFRWLTVTACSEATLIKQGDIRRQPCTTYDSWTSLYYDLSSLSGTVLYVNSSDGKAEYQFSVCSPLQKSNCTKSGTGVCKYVKEKNIAVSKGQANTNLRQEEGNIYLNYTDGMACGNNQRSYTIIIFKCSRTNNDLLVNQGPCVTVITWTSSMICKNRYDIKRAYDLKSSKKINHLSILTRHQTNYIVPGMSNTTQYHLNVGIPLVEDQFTTCSNYGTGACKVVVDDEGRRISELNLGFQEPDTHITIDGDMHLRYLNGSICEEDHSKRISTEVNLLCDWVIDAIGDALFNLDDRYPKFDLLSRLFRIEQGTPKFKGYDDCKYYFDWKSIYHCDWIYNKISEGCHIQNAHEIFNFTYLNENSLFKVNGNKSGHFSGSYYKDKYKCNGKFICNTFPYNGIDESKLLDSMDRRNTFAVLDLTTKVDFTNTLVAFKFANESQCEKNTRYKDAINKWCKIWAGIAEPFLIKEEECTIGLDWDEPATTVGYSQIILIALLVSLLIVLAALALGIAIYRRNREIAESPNDAKDHNFRFGSLERGSEPTVDVLTQ